MPDEVFKYLNISRDMIVHEYFNNLISLKENLEELRNGITPVKEELLNRYREMRKA